MGLRGLATGLAPALVLRLKVRRQLTMYVVDGVSFLKKLTGEGLFLFLGYGLLDDTLSHGLWYHHYSVIITHHQVSREDSYVPASDGQLYVHSPVFGCVTIPVRSPHEDWELHVSQVGRVPTCETWSSQSS